MEAFSIQNASRAKFWIAYAEISDPTRSKPSTNKLLFRRAVPCSSALGSGGTTLVCFASKSDDIIQSWDTASKSGPANDWSVCTTWLIRQGEYFLVDLFRGKLDYPDLRARALGLAQTYGPRMVLVEETGVGMGLVVELRTLRVNVSPVCPATSKEARASNQSAKFEGGQIRFPERAPWLSELEAELLSFPGSRHDDQVDSIVQALAYEAPAPVKIRWVSLVKGFLGDRMRQRSASLTRP